MVNDLQSFNVQHSQIIFFFKFCKLLAFFFLQFFSDLYNLHFMTFFVKLCQLHMCSNVIAFSATKLNIAHSCRNLARNWALVWTWLYWLEEFRKQVFLITCKLISQWNISYESTFIDKCVTIPVCVLITYHGHNTICSKQDNMIFFFFLSSIR